MRFTAIAALCLLISAPVFAHHQQDQQQQQDDRDKAKQQKQDERQKQDQDRQQQDGKAQQDERSRQDEKAQQQERARQEKQQRDSAKQQEKQQKDMDKQQKQNERDGGAREMGAENGRTRHGGRMISEDRFHASFGHEHHFRIGHRPDNRQFVYGGYTFEYVEGWPADWGYADVFYIDYIDDDYYLCDLDHPGVRLLVIVID